MTKPNIRQRGIGSKAIPNPISGKRGIVGGEREGERGGEHFNLYHNPNPKTLPKRGNLPATASDAPAGLLELIDGWNGLGRQDRPQGRRRGIRDPPAGGPVCTAGNEPSKTQSRAHSSADVPAVLAAIRGAKFCRGEGWFTIPWLFECRNKNSEFNIVRLMAGTTTEKTGIIVEMEPLTIGTVLASDLRLGPLSSRCNPAAAAKPP